MFTAVIFLETVVRFQSFNEKRSPILTQLPPRKIQSSNPNMSGKGGASPSLLQFSACGLPDIQISRLVCHGCELEFHLRCTGMPPERAVALMCVSSAVMPCNRWPLGVKTNAEVKRSSSVWPLDINDLRNSDGNTSPDLRLLICWKQKAVLSMLEKLHTEGLQKKPDRERKKRFFSISDMFMKRCHNVLRHAAAADDAKVFCNMLGRKLINHSDSNDEGILGSSAMVARPLDLGPLT